jgi:uncharacterized protein YegL
MKKKQQGAPKHRKPLRKAAQHKLPFYGGAVTQPRNDSFVNRLFYIALAGSLLFHLIFVLYSTRWQVADVSKIESQVETLFQVKLRDLSQMQYQPRQTTQETRNELDKTVQQDVDQLGQQNTRNALSDLSQSLPNLSDQTVPNPNQRGDSDGNYYVSDRTARTVITSNVGEKTVANFEQGVGENLINDWVETQRLALLGRGGASSQRVSEGLPEPELTREPVGTRAINMSLMTNLAPPIPEFEVSEPPIDLPSDTELLPSPGILPDDPASVPLKDEEIAIAKMNEEVVIIDDLVEIELYTYHHIGGDGYFMIRIKPKAVDERLKILHKDIIFVLDASGSMGRLRINHVKNGIRQALDRLRPEDRFNIVGFKEEVRFFVDDFVAATNENKEKAADFIAPLSASGKTDIYSSLEPLVQMETGRARPLIVLMFSDGRPNVGLIDSRKIINNLSQYRGPNTSIFSIGTGEDINRYLLDMLTFRNRGLVWFEPDRKEVPDLTQNVFRYLENPVLMRIQASFANVNDTEVYPKILPDLYLNGELKLWGKLHGETEIPLRLVGEAFDEKKDIVINLPVPKFDNGTFEVAREWARSKIYHTAGKMVYEGEKQEYLDEINFLTKTYRVQTPYTE